MQGVVVTIVGIGLSVGCGGYGTTTKIDAKQKYVQAVVVIGWSGFYLL